ncbi:MAG: phosphoglycerate dehydrogenase [Pseudomonadota bacterium]|nr:phosphoglycerate dehydrogenase [Pseudomonadota bacterium]
MTRAFRVLVLNQISPFGLERLPSDIYQVGKDIETPDAVLVRSADMHSMTIPESVLAIGRAGAGTNNIPVGSLSRRGVPVFNAPGANANAVKELVIAAMLMASRNLPEALGFVRELDATDPDLERRVEDGKKRFSGYELTGRTLGVIGLGRIGALVAQSAIELGMDVIGYDPEITVDAAWSLSSQVRRAGSVAELLKASEFVSVHVPLLESTRHLIDARNIELMRRGSVLMNFSREGIVDDAAAVGALDSGQLARYVCDFPNRTIHGHPRTVALPHLGASTTEAEDNCASMVAEQLRDYLENGNVRNSVNFPLAVMPRSSSWRLGIVNANVPNMLGQISTAMAEAGLNIDEMLNKSRGDIAYTIVDSNQPVPDSVVERLRAIDGVLRVRYLPLPA